MVSKRHVTMTVSIIVSIPRCKPEGDGVIVKLCIVSISIRNNQILYCFTTQDPIKVCIVSITGW